MSAAPAAEPDSDARSFDRWLREALARIEAFLAERLPGEQAEPVDLHRGMRYAVLDGGKRVRPLLAYAAGELVGAPTAVVDHAAAAVELIHAYSLVHDDLPCMDDDVLRRGKPTVHVAFGEATAMLVGDALQAQAFGLLADAARAGARPEAIVRMLAELACAAGSLGMAGGQAIDLASVGRRIDRDTLQRMHERKTGAMLKASVLMGADCGRPLSADERQALVVYADAVGLAFQIVDDILDVEADSGTLGKTAGKDAQHDKPTYVSLLGLDQSKELAQSLRRQAHSALAGFGVGAGRLGALADMIVLRKS